MMSGSPREVQYYSVLLTNAGISPLGQIQAFRGDIVTNQQDRQALANLLNSIKFLPGTAATNGSRISREEFTITKKNDTPSDFGF